MTDTARQILDLINRSHVWLTPEDAAALADTRGNYTAGDPSYVAGILTGLYHGRLIARQGNEADGYAYARLTEQTQRWAFRSDDAPTLDEEQASSVATAIETTNETAPAFKALENAARGLLWKLDLNDYAEDRRGAPVTIDRNDAAVRIMQDAIRQINEQRAADDNPAPFDMLTATHLPNGARILSRLSLHCDLWLVLCSRARSAGTEFIVWTVNAAGDAVLGSLFADHEAAQAHLFTRYDDAIWSERERYADNA